MIKTVKVMLAVLPTMVVAIAAVYLYRNITTDETIEQLITENTQLREAISNLTDEERIGYARVVSQTHRDGRLYTNLLFVETAPNDPSEQIFRQEFEIDGDIAHFDLMVVKFDKDLVADGKERAMYMWRRVYGEATPPEKGHLIHTPGEPSPRYKSLSAKLSIQQKELFWSQIWELSNDPKRLEKSGITAVFGNVVYKQMRPGLVYIFKASPTGSIHPEIIPLL